jgi:hypothetical protein
VSETFFRARHTLHDQPYERKIPEYNKSVGMIILISVVIFCILTRTEKKNNKKTTMPRGLRTTQTERPPLVHNSAGARNLSFHFTNFSAL